MINPNAYYTVQGWMREELGLKGNALAVYAIIYGFSQDGASEYAGSSRYLAEWLGCDKKTILRALADLTEKGYLVKKTIYQNGVTFCNYVTARPSANDNAEVGDEITPPGTKCPQGGGKLSPGVGTKCPQGGDKMSSHITSHNTRYINIDIKREGADAQTPPTAAIENDKKPVKHKHGEYNNVLLTDQELDKLRTLFPLDLPQRIERLSEYIASTGKTYKSHYATIRSWANRDKKDSGPRGRAGRPGNLGPNGIAIDPSKTDLDGAF